MIYLITGQPGNGKTLRAMALMLEEYERNAQAVKEGKEQPRRFFSNVKGATADDPEAPNPDAFPWVERLPEHNDWTQLPDGAFVQYDEAHADGKTPGLERYGHLFPSTGRPGESDDQRIRAMSTHRHKGVDLVLITQWPSKVHHQVRTLVGKHIHMNRAMGLQRAGVLTWTRTQADPYDERQRDKAEEEIWAYPKDLYKRYVSATLHTASYKFRIPRKLWGALSMLFMGIFVAWMLWQFFFKPSQAKPVEEGTAAALARTPSGVAAVLPGMGEVVSTSIPPTGDFYALDAPAIPDVAGYIDSDRGCRMWGADGRQLDITTAECRRLVDRGLPVNLGHEYRSGRSDNRGQDDTTTSPGMIGGGVVLGAERQVHGYGDVGSRAIETADVGTW